MLARIINFVKTHHSEITLALVIICITIISYNIGRGMGQGTTKNELSIIAPQTSGGARGETAGSGSSGLTAPAKAPRDASVVASKASSSKLYHFTYCSGAQRIAEKNKLTFPTDTAAIAAGYTLASNCQK